MVVAAVLDSIWITSSCFAAAASENDEPQQAGGEIPVPATPMIVLKSPPPTQMQQQAMPIEHDDDVSRISPENTSDNNHDDNDLVGRGERFVGNDPAAWIEENAEPEFLNYNTAAAESHNPRDPNDGTTTVMHGDTIIADENEERIETPAVPAPENSTRQNAPQNVEEKLHDAAEVVMEAIRAQEPLPPLLHRRVPDERTKEPMTATDKEEDEATITDEQHGGVDEDLEAEQRKNNEGGESEFFDDRTLLDIFGEAAKEYLTQKVVRTARDGRSDILTMRVNWRIAPSRHANPCCILLFSFVFIESSNTIP
jgi:hypothetical protein